jgi:predicted nucleic acid-binding protein
VRAAVSLDEVVSSRLLITELPRTIRHKAAVDRRVDLALGLRRAEVVLDAVDLHPIAGLALWRAGKLFEPYLRSLDAIHLTTALELRPIRAFLSYDLRQIAAARETGLRTVSPGMRP